jgi:hypothetical protein
VELARPGAGVETLAMLLADVQPGLLGFMPEAAVASAEA